VVSDDPLQPGHVPPRKRIANFALIWPNHIAFSHNSATDLDKRIKFGSNDNDNDNDNDKRLGRTAKADQPDHKKCNTLKIKMDNEAVQKFHTS